MSKSIYELASDIVVAALMSPNCEVSKDDICELYGKIFDKIKEHEVENNPNNQLRR